MKKYEFKQFAATRLFGGVSYSPDGKTIAYVDNTTGQFNLWTMPAGGGIPRQLTTFSDNAVRGFSWSPDGKVIAFMADEDGNEQTQIYMVEAAGSWPERITHALDRRYTIGDWSPDGKHLMYTANDDNPAMMDIIIRDLASGEQKRVIKDAGINFGASYSPDGKYATILRLYSNINQDILVMETESDEMALATPHDGAIMFMPGEWSPDSSGFYFFTNQGREFRNVAFYNVADGKWDWVFTPDHDVDDMAIAKDGSTMVYVVNDNGRNVLYGFDAKSGDALPMPELPLGVISTMDIAPDGSRLVMTFVSPREATNIYEIDLKTGDLVKLGQSMLGGIDPDDLLEPELVYFESFDGRQIPAWLYKPKTQADSYPVVLSIHGGPEAQERPVYNYNGLYQYWLNRGIGVLAPNIRGSSGYGISYQKLIHRDWGGDELKDIEHAAKYLQQLDWVDGNRLAVFGGSFGGFATLSAVTRLPDYWAAGVDIVGPCNLVTFANSIPEWWKGFRKDWVGDPEEDYDMLMERSPITYVENIKAPLLVIQGANDPRVVKAESDQMVEKMRELGLEVEYYVDPEEGHGATRRENGLKWMQMTAEYLETHLLPQTEQNASSI